MSQNKNSPQLKQPPQPPVQISVTSSAQNLQTLASYPGTNLGNYGGIQIKNLSTNTNSVFWGTTSAVTTSNGDEIPAVTSQIIGPALARDETFLYLVARW